MHLHLSRFGSTPITSTFLLCIKIVNMDAACLWREKSTQETQRTLSLSRVSYQQFFQLYNWSALMLVTAADILLAACLTISSTTSCVRYCSQVIEYCSCIGEACDGNKIFLEYRYCIITAPGKWVASTTFIPSCCTISTQNAANADFVSSNLPPWFGPTWGKISWKWYSNWELGHTHSSYNVQFVDYYICPLPGTSRWAPRPS